MGSLNKLNTEKLIVSIRKDLQYIVECFCGELLYEITKNKIRVKFSEYLQDLHDRNLIQYYYISFSDNDRPLDWLERIFGKRCTHYIEVYVTIKPIDFQNDYGFVFALK
jgi:hypothetical protein